MSEVIDVSKDRSFLLEAAMNYRTQDRPLMYIRGLLVPACLTAEQWWYVFSGRDMFSPSQRVRVDHALIYLHDRAKRPDEEFQAAINHLKEFLE